MEIRGILTPLHKQQFQDMLQKQSLKLKFDFLEGGGGLGEDYLLITNYPV